MASYSDRLCELCKIPPSFRNRKWQLPDLNSSDNFYTLFNLKYPYDGGLWSLTETMAQTGHLGHAATSKKYLQQLYKCIVYCNKHTTWEYNRKAELMIKTIRRVQWKG